MFDSLFTVYSVYTVHLSQTFVFGFVLGELKCLATLSSKYPRKKYERENVFVFCLSRSSNVLHFSLDMKTKTEFRSYLIVVLHVK